VPFVVAGCFVQRAIFLLGGHGVVIELLYECKALNVILGCNTAFAEASVPPSVPHTTIEIAS
jgi:hypothetical protein